MLRPIASRIDLKDALRRASVSNDLLPPRDDDTVGGDLARRFVERLAEQIEAGTYAPDRAAFIQVPKPGFTSRPAALLTLEDRVVYEALLELFRPALAKYLVQDAVVLWPREQNTKKRWREFEAAPFSTKSPYIVQADIAGFYESLSHESIRERLIQATGDRPGADAVTSFLNAVMGSVRGVPQGLLPSDALATVYLQPLDATMIRADFEYWRHGDDIRIAADNFERAREAIATFEDGLRQLGLLMNSSKCAILTRRTYKKSLEEWTSSDESTRADLLSAKIKEVTSDPEDLVRAMERAGLDDQWGWDLFYHGRIRVEDVIEKIREHLLPSDIEVAEKIFIATVNKSPDKKGGLSKEVFHQRLIGSLVRLAAGRSTVGIPHCASIALKFPDKTESVCSYFESILGSSSKEIGRELYTILRSPTYFTPWQHAWLLRTLSKVRTSFPESSLKLISALSDDEARHWIVRIEGLKVLGQCGRLTNTQAQKAWKLAPRVYRPDILAAVNPMRKIERWADKFFAVTHLDPLERVIASHLSRAIQEK